MKAKRQAFLTAKVLVLAVFLSLGMARSSHAQLEPEAWTILKVALSANPPRPADALMMLRKYKDRQDHQKMQDAWLRMLAERATGKVDVKRKKLADLLDAFADSFVAGENGKQRAKTFIKLREELLARTTAGMVVEQSASALVDRLRALTDADRRLLQEFGSQAKGRIKIVVE